jgi:hypothetical protein
MEVLVEFDIGLEFGKVNAYKSFKILTDFLQSSINKLQNSSKFLLKILELRSSSENVPCDFSDMRLVFASEYLADIEYLASIQIPSIDEDDLLLR